MELAIIKDYLVISVLGQGGMAKVFLAEHKSLGHKVAIKVLNKEFYYNENIRKRFLAEARNLAQMSHPNIVRVTDLIEENESAAFVMEYIEGSTLRDYLEEKGKLKDDQIQHLFGQMLDAVGYVHEQGLIHRDIKPSNFMLDGRGNIKLLDFGIAKATDTTSAEYTQTGTGVQLGTPMYMSPEQILATKSVTPQSDIYSLGVVLWQMVAGKKPYDVTTLSDFDMKTKIVNDALKETGSRWDTEIQTATSKEISKRYKSCTDWKNNVDGKLFKPKENQVKETERTIVESGHLNPIQKPKQNTNIPVLFAGIGIFSLVMALIFWQPWNSSKQGNTITKSTDLISQPNDSIPVKSDDKIVEESVPSETKNAADIRSNDAENSAKHVSENLQEIYSETEVEAKEVTIGDQEWMTINLSVDRFRNGDLIPEARSKEEWSSACNNGTPAWCYYDNNHKNGKKYGKLYNWFAVNDQRGLAPKGWHIPTLANWESLIIKMGGYKESGKKLKSQNGWLYGKGSNSSGFSALPGGYRSYSGQFFYLGEHGDWWSSTELDHGWAIFISDANQQAQGMKGAGKSLRCIRD